MGLSPFRPGICCCTGFRFHLLAGLTDFLEAALLVPQLIGELAAQVSLAVALVALGIQDLGVAHQGMISCCSCFSALIIFYLDCLVAAASDTDVGTEIPSGATLTSSLALMVSG